MKTMGRKKKTYKDYKESGRKTAFIPYLFDKTFPFFVTVLTLAGLVGIGIVVKDGYDTFDRIRTQPEETSPYQNISAVNSPGMDWGNEIIRIKPPTVKKWEVSETNKPQNAIDPKTCSYIQDIPTSLLSTNVASGSGIETKVQVYGAGQAAKNFNAYNTALEKCETVETASTETAGVSKFDNNFIMTMGDTIVAVKTPNKKTQESLIKFYIEQVEKTLKKSSCLALEETVSDANRSFFYNEKEYVGLKESKKLETTVNIDNLPTPTSMKVLDIKNEYATEPESPLPKDFPKVPSKKEEPNLPNKIKDKTAFEGTATYKIMDENGPGCGWDWSAQVAPQYDEKSMLEDQKKTISTKQKEINDKALDYVHNKLQWSFDTGLIAPKVDEWNTYVNKLNKVHEKWYWLDNEREKLKTPWYNYVDAHNNWETFDDRKEKATDEYDKKLEECKAKQDELDDWEDKWGDYENNKKKEEKKKKDKELESPDDNESNPTETTSPTEEPEPEPEPTETEEPPVDVPEKPEGCKTLPQRPAIMGQEKPNEPKAPKIPEGVTIPNSWPKA